MFSVTLESTLRQDWSRACYTIADGLHDAVRHAVDEAADEARKAHRYKDRTGNLTRSIYSRIVAYDRLSAEGEFGALAAYASYVEDGTKPHKIVARNAQSLRWTDEGGAVHFARSVNHPGTKPNPFMGPAYLKAERALERDALVAIERAQGGLN